MVSSSGSSSSSSSSSSNKKKQQQIEHVAVLSATPTTYVSTVETAGYRTVQPAVTTTSYAVQPAVTTSYSVHSGGQVSSSIGQQYVVQHGAVGQTAMATPGATVTETQYVVQHGGVGHTALAPSSATVGMSEGQYVQYVTDPRQVHQYSTTTTTYKEGATTYKEGGTTYTKDATTYKELATPMYLEGTTVEYTGHLDGGVSIGAYATGEKVYGAQRLVSETSRIDESRTTVISERVIEKEVRIPKKIVREEVVEKVIRIPEKQIIEEVIEESCIVREKIIEIAKPTIIEKVIEIPEISIVERIVEVPEKIIQEKIIEQERMVEKDVIINIPKIIEREKIVEVPIIEYNDVPYENTVLVDDITEVIVEKKVAVPTYVPKPVPEHVQVPKPVYVERKIPVPIEAEVTYEYKLPTIHPRYTKTSYPVYLPRFIEVPVATELLNQDLTAKSHKFLSQVSQLTKNAASLCEIEGLAAQIMKTDFQSQLQSGDLQAAVLSAWKSEALPLHHETGQIMSKAVGAELVSSAPGFQTTHTEITTHSVASQPTLIPSTGPIGRSMLVTTTTAEPIKEGKKHKKHHKKHHNKH